MFFFYGDHTFEAHTRSLVDFSDVLDNNFVCFVENWNWETVREGTLKSIEL